MKRLLLTMTALATVAGAAPAVAQYYAPRPDARALTGADFRDRIHRLELRLDADVRAGVLTGPEELTLRRQLVNLRRLERQYSIDGLSLRERDNLMTQIRAVRQNISYADNGRYDRDTRYSWNDDRIYGRAYGGMGGPMEAVDSCRDHNGLSGVVQDVLGRSCFQVGDRVTRNLFAVPYAYRNEYRDTADVYYRYDGNLIYAIDLDTNRVISSFAVN